MGLFDLSVTCGYIVGPVIGGILYSKYGVTYPFLSISAIIFVIAIIGAVVISDVGENMRREHVIKIPHEVLPLTMVWIIAMFVLSIGQLVVPRYAEEVGISSADTGILLGIVGGTLMVSYVVFGKISDRIGRKTPMIFGLGLASVSIMLLAVFLSWDAMKILLPVIAIGGGAFAPAGMAILGEMAPKNLRGTVMGIYDFSISIGMILGQIYGGIVKDLFGYRALFLSCSVFVLIALTVLSKYLKGLEV